MVSNESSRATRKKKYNADFFLHDSNAGNDPKIRALISKMGITGYGMLFMLYEKLASSDYFEISLVEDYEKENLVSMLFTSEDQFDTFLQYCIRFKLLIFEDGRLFSSGLKKRLTPILDRRLKDNIRKTSQSQHDDTIPLGLSENSNNSSRNNSDKNKNKKKSKEYNNPLTPLEGGTGTPQKDDAKPDWNTTLLKIFQEEFEASRGFPYALTSYKGKEAKQINEVYRKYLQMKESMGIIPNTEQALQDMRTFCRISMNIKDKWIYDNMCPGVLSTKFTTIATMMKENRNGTHQQSNISDRDIERIAVKYGLL